MVSVATTDCKPDRALSKSPSLALHTCESIAIVDDEVVAHVLAEWDEYPEARLTQSENDRERCSVADVLGVIHSLRLPSASAGPWPKQTTA